jgi:nucleotide-binding universal stress UspA family protein
MVNQTEPVVVGYDGAADSDRAVDWAVRAGEQYRRPVLVIVVAPDEAILTTAVIGWDDEMVRNIAERARQRLAKAGATDATVEVRAGAAAAVLVAAGREASMVVLGTRGHGVFADAMIGSVSQHVARHAPCPVVVVRQTHHEDAGRVVVGVDGSGGSRAALEFACDHAQLAGLSVTAIHAFRPSGHLGSVPQGYFSATPPSQEMVERLDAAERLVAESVAGLSESHPDVVVETEAIPGPAHRVLLDASLRADLLVVGSRGRGAFEGMLLGSVSQGVLHSAHCPVAAVR